MTETTALNIVASSIGLCAAVFFCIGSAINTTKKIIAQSTPYWDFSEPVALALAAQQAQYATGALLLAIAFPLQVVASQASSSIEANLPLWLCTWPRLGAAVLVPTGLLAASLSCFLHRGHKRRIQKHKEAIKKES